MTLPPDDSCLPDRPNVWSRKLKLAIIWVQKCLFFRDFCHWQTLCLVQLDANLISAKERLRTTPKLFSGPRKSQVYEFRSKFEESLKLSVSDLLQKLAIATILESKILLDEPFSSIGSSIRLQMPIVFLRAILLNKLVQTRLRVYYWIFNIASIVQQN